MKTISNFFVFFILLSQTILAQNHEKLDSVSVSIPSISLLNKAFTLPPKSSYTIAFDLENLSNREETKFIKFSKVENARLYEINNSSITLLGKSGARIAIIDRDIIDDNSTLKVKLKANESKKLLLVFDNFLSEDKIIEIKLLDNTEYQALSNQKKATFYEKYWKNFFFTILVLALVLTLFQLLILPEKALIFYFFYVLFTLIRALGANETLAIENYFSFLRAIGYHSVYSQVFTYTSFIFYVLFMREFTGFRAKKPKLDWGFKLHIGFLLFFILFDILFPTEKYTNPAINQAFRALETVGMLMGLYILFLLTRVYDSFNKFIIIGAFSLVIIALIGQEIIKRNIDGNENPELFNQLLSILWSVGYMVEIVFFTIALVNRQRVLLKTLSIEKEHNQILNEKIIAHETSQIIEPIIKPNESFSLATNRGVLIFQQSDIVRLEASGNYTIFTIQNQNQTLGSYTLADFESKLNPFAFLRVHKSHVVNLKYVIKYTKGDGGWLTLQDGSVIPVSRSRKEEVLKRLHFS